MGLRFRKSFKVAPGVRLNSSTRGFGLSLGGRGASVSFGSRGVYGNAGIPGTGISYRTRLDSPNRANNARSRSYATPSIPSKVRYSLKEDGRVELQDLAGNPLPSRIKKIVLETQGAEVQTWLEDQCERWNQGIESILDLHLATPHPAHQVGFIPEPFSLSAPTPMEPKALGLFGRLFRSRREAIERENTTRAKINRLSRADWEAARKRHAMEQERRCKLFEIDRLSDPEGFLEGVLGQIAWPRETQVSLEVSSDGRLVFLDVDLPEIEDMPAEQASVAARGLKLNIKSRSNTQRRKEYMRHIHAIAFRLVGETFAALPTVKMVVCSGYSQRADKATARIDDEYLFSVRVQRSLWMRIDFDYLTKIDLPACLAEFDLRRKMTKTGIFTAIEPFAS